MRVFLTGATGFVGSRILSELLADGHEVIGLTRSERGARQLAELGAEAHLGTIADLDRLRAGASGADAVIHTAFDHDFSKYAANCEQDGAVIAALGSALRGSDRPLILTSITGIGDAGDGHPASEAVFNADLPHPRIASERAGNALLDAGVDVRVVRLPQVHDPVKQGLISPYIDHARDTGMAATVGDGGNRWCAAHVGDVARLYALALSRGERGARYHAVAEEGVAFRDIARAVGAGLNVPVRALEPEEAEAHFGWLSMFVSADMVASSIWTRMQLRWTPTGPGLLDDLAAMPTAMPTGVD
ncbi:SDR family oxidoreductase [Salinarimonas ramus]|uniref:NAD-dependent dehydratase n=1 Tax=Salinarimonas ramus TaxID=690164 RepID=A0A917QIF2_9HYPH|nr:SDR family oxidoreductase [Salinarimonas ramus]GGK52777.1 NAD-dependent dehydratase [Salinarimonas ramus]